MNEHIDHSNYEAWLLDRLEGNLSPEQDRALDAFLLQHPELAAALDELPTVDGIEAQLSKLDKEALKRTLPPIGLVSQATLDDQLIARSEGDLDQAQLDALRIYLLDHPEHARTERLYALTKLVPEAVAYAAKKDIERHLPPKAVVMRHTLDDHLVARMEGELSAEQERALTTYLAAHPEAQRSWTLMQATRIVNTAVLYPHKASLKKGGRVIPIGRVPWVRLAAAATVALLLGLGAWLLKAPSVEAPGIVQVPPKSSAPTPNENVVPDGPYESVPKKDMNVPSGSNAAPVPVTQAPKEDPSPAVVPVPAHMEREEELPIAQQVPAKPNEAETPRSIDVVVPAAPPTIEEPLASAITAPATNAPKTVGQLFAATVRERVLEQPEPESRPLDGDDAIAMVDRGLKAVAGDRTGLAVERKDDGGVRGFNLRLGRNLSISASR
ncbi:MAG: hypothetical protein JNL43_13815 [Flavobacteriales bacterium]|nr:hypothetical protein [Flavobacteriales bacterium]